MNDGSAPIKVGVNLSTVGVDQIAETVTLAEALGFESAWIGEHVVSPVSWTPYAAESAFEGPSAYLEPLVTLAHAAASTSRIRLGTGVIIGPLRDPFLTARACATVDVLSEGRLEIGVGVGWLEEEFELMGSDFRTRGRRADEFIGAVDALLSQAEPEFHGVVHDFPKVDFAPRPVQTPRPRIHTAGHSAPALRRAARLADGWIGDALTRLDGMPVILARLRAELGAAGRDESGFASTLARLSRLSRQELDAAAEMGFERVVVAPWAAAGTQAPIGRHADLDELRSFAHEIGMTPSDPQSTDPRSET